MSTRRDWQRRMAIAALAALIAATAVDAVAGGDQGESISSARGLPEYGPASRAGALPATPGRYPHAFHLASADFNADGKRDILAVRAQWRSGLLFPPVILVDDGSGHFTDRTSELFVGAVPRVMGPRRVLIADFNLDGRPDVFIGDSGTDLPTDPGHQNTLILSAPGGKLVDATSNLPQQDMYTHAAAVADVNGDGAPDLFIGGMGSIGRNEIQINDGHGRFTIEPGGIPDELSDPRACRVVLSAAFADVNRDGATDLILGGGSNPCYPMPTGVLLNDGHGRFPSLTQAFPSPPYGFDSPSDVAVGDITGDGAPDIVIAYTKHQWTGSYLQLLINDGKGRFADQTPRRLPQIDNDSTYVWWLGLVDLNRDGRLDIATTVLPSSLNRPVSSPDYLNDGAGDFWSLPDNLGLGGLQSYVLTELGGGRGLDILSGGDDTVWIRRTIRPSGHRLYATVTSRQQVSLQTEAGARVRLVHPGRHQILLLDKTQTTAFRLTGPNVDLDTTGEGPGVHYYIVNLRKRSVYSFGSSPAASRSSSFRTSAR